MFLKKTKIVELIGVASIVGSLVFVGYEMHQSQSISQAEQDLSRAQINSELNISINENIEVWLMGNAGQELDEISKNIYANLIRNAWDSAEALSQARSRIGSEAHVAIHQFAAFLYENPGAKTTWIEMIDQERSNRDKLLYNIPGMDQRMEMVFRDLEILGQEESISQ